MSATAVKVALSDDFLFAFSRLGREKQQGVMRFLTRFRNNPKAAGINYEAVRQARDQGVHSVRIDQDYRGIVLKPEQGNVYCLLWVDKHDDAYDWARRHRVVLNPEVGNIQVFEAIHDGEIKTPGQTSPQTPRLFDALKDRELLKLGVPEDTINLVRSISDEEALDAASRLLPKDAYDALYLFAAGYTYEDLLREREKVSEKSRHDFRAALDHPETRRHFVVVTEDREIEELLAAPLEKWRVFLHPSQRKLVEGDWNGPIRVLGGAGTGKTVVAMHRAVWLARKYRHCGERPILFTTFSKTLAKDIESQITHLAGPGESKLIEVVHVDAWAATVLKRLDVQGRLLFDDRTKRDYWKVAAASAPNQLQLPVEFYRAEYERVVLPQGCSSAEEYARASRIGRGGQLNRAKRVAIWPVFAEYGSLLKRAGYLEPEEAYRLAQSMVGTNREQFKYRAVVVDETQDLSAAALGLLRAVVPNAQDDMFLVGDAHQRIYRHKVILSQVGIDIRGRGRRLRLNYRTTDEIRRWAVSQLDGCSVDDLDGQADTLKGYKSLTHGPRPECLHSGSRAEERAILKSKLEQLDLAGIDPKQICIVSRTNADADRYAEWCSNIGKDALRLSSSATDDRTKPGIRIATMHRVKGLEFDAVIIAGYRGPNAYVDRLQENEDAGVLVDSLTSERSLLHVAATRAKRYLFISSIS